ncbi:MAG: TIM-barrel domain-containing protein [Phycisphaerae bacterium]
MSGDWHVKIEQLSPRTARVVLAPAGTKVGPTFAVRDPHPAPVLIPTSGRVELCDGKLVVQVADDGQPPHKDNLQIQWSSRGKRRTWRPGDLDHENLGAPFLALDNLWRDFVPHGVHAADPLVAYDERIRNTAVLTAAIETAVQEATGRFPDTAQRNAEVRRLLSGEPSAHRPGWPAAVLEAREIVRRSPPGLLTRSGLTIFRDDTPPWNSETEWIAPRPDPQPVVLYLLYHDCDWRLAARELVDLLGPIPTIPPFLLGVWYSNYSRLGAADFKRLAAEFARHSLPLDTISVDMDWHGKQWYGYDWNKELFPAPEAFAVWLREQDLRAAFNVHPLYLPADEPRLAEFIQASKHSGQALGPHGEWHPLQADCVKVDIHDRRQADAYMRIFHTSVERGGCDFWWIDGCVRRPDGRDECSWLNHVYRSHLAKQDDHTPIVLARAGGLAAHRDAILFTGDTCAQWEVLAFEVETAVRAAGALIAYVSHDIGGFYHDPRAGPENKPPDDLYVRWVQFGCLSSIMRLHSFHGVREPWRFGPRVLRITRHFMLLRMRLVPYLHALAEEAHRSGVPLVRPMWLEFADEDAYARLGQYMLGPLLLVVPVVRQDARVRYWLPPGRWYDAFSDRTQSGPAWIEEAVPLETIPLWSHDGAVLELGEPALRTREVLSGPRHRVTGGNWASLPEAIDGPAR